MWIVIGKAGPADHGDALVERVIAALYADPRRLLDYEPLLDEPLLTGPPQPMSADVLATMTLPSGRTLPSSVRRWLEFDAPMLARSGWLAYSRASRLTPRRLDEIAAVEFSEDWGVYYAPLADRFDECFLLPGGADSRRVFVTGPADESGEYPVFAIDIDDPVYAPRMRQHAQNWFRGKVSAEYPFRLAR